MGDPRMATPVPYGSAGGPMAGHGPPMPMGSPRPGMHGMQQPHAGAMQPHEHHQMRGYPQQPARSRRAIWVTVGVLLAAAVVGIGGALAFAHYFSL